MTIALLPITSLLEDLACGSEKFTVVDTRPEQEYLSGHVPGAVRIPWEEWCQPAPADAAAILHQPGYWGTLADAEKQGFQQRLIDAGIKVHGPLVIYADSARSKGREGRVAWMLLYLGATNVFLLNGGWNSWLSAKGPVETGLQLPLVKGDFQIALNKLRRVEHHEVFAGAQLPLMIDTRSSDEFNGQCYDYQPIKGRLPNSILFPFASLFNDDGTFISRERYLEIVPQDILSKSAKVSYCEVGVRASTFSLLHEIYTGEIIPVYDGSIMEWGWRQLAKVKGP